MPRDRIVRRGPRLTAGGTQEEDMSDRNTVDPITGAVSTVRTALGIGGVLLTLFGVAVLWRPGATFAVLFALVAAYAVLQGLVLLGIGIFSQVQSGWARVGDALLGLLFIVAGVLAFTNIEAGTEAFAIVIGIMVGIAWIFEGVLSLTLIGSTGVKAWTILFAILSIIAGVLMLSLPGLGGLALWVWGGALALVLGIVQIVRAFQVGRVLKD
jgi:uncharacterized membrane protein HdeD (DUF308 family)